MLAALSACTSAATAPDTPTPEMEEQTVSLRVSAPVTRVAGRLSEKDRLAVRREVEALVAEYVTAAFLDPGTPPDQLFPGFTEGATRLARTQGAVLSRADLVAGAATVAVASVEAPVNVLAPKGRPAGATARLDLTLTVTPPPDDDTGTESDADPDPGEQASQDVRLQGRLLLTPVGQGWKIFGFDVIRTGR